MQRANGATAQHNRKCSQQPRAVRGVYRPELHDACSRTRVYHLGHASGVPGLVADVFRACTGRRACLGGASTRRGRTCETCARARGHGTASWTWIELGLGPEARLGARRDVPRRERRRGRAGAKWAKCRNCCRTTAIAVVLQQFLIKGYLVLSTCTST